MSYDKIIYLNLDLFRCPPSPVLWIRVIGNPQATVAQFSHNDLLDNSVFFNLVVHNVFLGKGEKQNKIMEKIPKAY